MSKLETRDYVGAGFKGSNDLQRVVPKISETESKTLLNRFMTEHWSWMDTGLRCFGIFDLKMSSNGNET